MSTEQETWSGGRQAPQVRHRWQSDWAELQYSQFLAPPRRLRRAILILLFLAIGLFGAFVYALLYTPDKTPFLIIAATEYSWPTPINPWVQEDADAFGSLNARNLQVVDASGAWQSKEHGLAELRDRLDELEKSNNSFESIVIYLSMHGAVNDEGEPCLIPPGVATLYSQQWLPVREVLAVIQERLDVSSRKLLILDSNKLNVQWQLGILKNSFVEQLASVINELNIPGLAVMTAASDGELAWSSSELQGSIFGKHLRLGLAGAADISDAGNQDGQVTLHELHQYVRASTLAWARQNRAATQTPQLLPEAAPDVAVTWAINRRSLNALLAAEASTDAPPDSVAAEEITKLWQQLEAIRTAEILAYDPMGVHRLEQLLIDVESRATGGRGYAKSAERTFRKLKRQLDQISERHSALAESRSGVALAGVVSGTSDHGINTDALHSLATCEYFAGLPETTGREFRERLLALAKDPSEVELDSLLNEFSEKAILARLCETNLLRLACRYKADQLWTTGTPVATVLEARVGAENLVGLGDPRARRLARSQLVSLDTQLRAIEDRLFAGESTGVGSLDESRTLVADLQSAVDSPLVLASQACRIHDRAAADLPLLAKWFCRPLPVTATRDEEVQADAFINEVLLNAIAATERLGKVITSNRKTDGLSSPIVDVTHSAEDAVTVLREAFANDQDRLLDPLEQSAETLKEIDDILQLPIIPWANRLKLLQKQASLQLALHQSVSSETLQVADSSDGLSEQDPRLTYSERAASWNRHPLLAILRLDGLLEADNGQRSGNGIRVVRSDDVRQRIYGTALSRDDDENDTSRQPIDGRRVELSERSIAARRAAPIAVLEPATDPIAELRNFDWQESLLLQSQRSLDDFWGPIRSDQSERAPESYFAIAAAGYLAAAESVMPLRGELQQQAVSLQRELGQRKVAARRGLRLQAETDIQLDSNSGITVSVQVTNGESSDAASLSKTPFDGIGTLFVRSKQGLVDGARAAVVLSSAEERSKTYELSGTPADDSGRFYEAVAFFRGHEFSTPFLMEGLGGVRIDYQPQPRSPTQVTVFGDRRRRSSIVFVLDCSSSMGELISVEAIGASEFARLELATGALSALLGELAQRDDTRVGVRFYGHRIGWTKSQPVQALAQVDYAGEIPDDLSPSEDVELVLPLGRFDSVEAGKVLAKMESLKPWGQSPSYLALLRSLDDFEQEDRDTDRSIVVITDGRNYQFTPNGAPQSTTPPTTKSDLLSAWEGKNVPVYILGFGISQDESQQAEQEYQEIAEATGGAYFPINNGRDLLRTLRDRLSLGGYSVTDDRGKVISPHSLDQPVVKLNTPVRLPEIDGASDTYTINFESLSKQIEVTGGEAIALYASENGVELKAKPFDDGFPVAATLTRAGRAETFVLRAHRPQSHETGVTFPLSLQAEGMHYTRRPEHIWIEIEPVLKDREKTVNTYTFYDSNYDFGRPVPMLEWTAEGWPESVNEAMISAWVQFTAIEPIQTIKLDGVIQQPDVYSDFQKVNELVGIKYRLEVINENSQVKIKLIERHEGDSAGIHSMSVQLDSGRGLQPTRVLHQFDAENRLAIHSFYFPNGSLPSLEASATVNFYSRQSLQSGAWSVEGGALKVAIYGDGNTLPLNAATGER